MDMAPRVQDEAEDLKFLWDVKKRGESGGRRLARVGAGTVHLRLQLLFRVSVAVKCTSNRKCGCRDSAPAATAVRVSTPVVSNPVKCKGE